MHIVENLMSRLIYNDLELAYFVFQVLFSALVSVFIVYKGGQERNEVRNKEVACGVSI